MVQKTHDLGVQHIRSFDGRVVLLLRNPYDAILSFHNFLYGGHTGFAPLKNFERSGKTTENSKEWPLVHVLWYNSMRQKFAWFAAPTKKWSG